MDAIDAAQVFVNQRFPECSAAFLAGSIIRGEGTSTSDLDIVIITAREGTPYRESLREFGWPIEVFVNNSTSYREFFSVELEERRPRLPTMFAEGIILKDSDGTAQFIKEEARMLLEQGPEPLSSEEIIDLRYRITDCLDDFQGSEKFAESFFIANNLAAMASNLILASHRKWIGSGKWVPRALQRFDPDLARCLQVALVSFCQAGVKDDLIKFAEEALDSVGGRLFEGYSSGKRGA